MTPRVDHVNVRTVYYRLVVKLIRLHGGRNIIRRLDGANGYSDVQIKEYRNYIELARVWMKIHGKDKVTGE